MSDHPDLSQMSLREVHSYLVECAREESAGPALRARTMASAAAAAGAATALSAGAAAGTAATKGATVASTSALVKWGALGVVVVAGALGGRAIALWRTGAAQAPVAASSVTRSSSPAPPAAPKVEEPRAEEPPAAAPSSIAPRPPSPPASPPATAQSELLRELAVLDDARAALRARSPDRALALVDEHDRSFARPALGVEAEALRIEALAALGRTSEAVARARAFVARHPTSPLGDRVRKIAEASERRTP